MISHYSFPLYCKARTAPFFLCPCLPRRKIIWFCTCHFDLDHCIVSLLHPAASPSRRPRSAPGAAIHSDHAEETIQKILRANIAFLIRRRLSHFHTHRSLMSISRPVSVQGVIFDLDGTLIDYEGASHEALSDPLVKRGKTLSWELHSTIVGTKYEDWSKNIIASVGLEDSFTTAEYIAEYDEKMQELYATIPAWSGTLPLLKHLKQRGFPLAIATSSPRPITARSCSQDLSAILREPLILGIVLTSRCSIMRRS